MKVFQIFRKQYFFKAPVIFLRGKISLFFGSGHIKIYLIGSIVPVLENRKKCAITPSYSAIDQTH